MDFLQLEIVMPEWIPYRWK